MPLGRALERAPRPVGPPLRALAEERPAAEARWKAEESKSKAEDAGSKSESKTEEARSKSETEEARSESYSESKSNSEAEESKSKSEPEAEESKTSSESTSKSSSESASESESKAETHAGPDLRARSGSVTPPGSARGIAVSNPPFLIPRPHSSAGVAASPGPAMSDADALRERVAALEVTANAARSIASRLADQVAEASKRATEHAPRIAELERGLGSLEAHHLRDIEELRARVERPLSLEALEKRVEGTVTSHESTRALVQALRVDVDGHTRAFDARKIRIDAIEHELSGLRGERHLAELRRAIEHLDLRLAAIEQSVSALSSKLASPPAPAPRAGHVASGPLRAPTDGVEGLVRIKGVGPKTARVLVEAGVRSLAHIAAWDDAALARVASLLGKKPVQLQKAGWIEEARMLLDGGADSAP
jgi:predicted flap endonuclease-1-like 5' DNA nuclease